MYVAFDPASEIPCVRLVHPDRALAALAFRCARIEYTASKGHVHQRDVYWVPLASVGAVEGAVWFWLEAPPAHPVRTSSDAAMSAAAAAMLLVVFMMPFNLTSCLRAEESRV